MRGVRVRRDEGWKLVGGVPRLAASRAAGRQRQAGRRSPSDSLLIETLL